MFIIITGTVIPGKQQGRALGFPTANIKVDSDINVEPGIYAASVVISNQKYPVALYVPGTNLVEAFILDFTGNLYDQRLSLVVIKKIREKRDFKSSQEASAQIAQDVAEVKALFSKPTQSEFGL